MKKIVMGMAALAMAASIFAADVSAKVDIDGKLFNYKADKTLKAGETTTVESGSAFTLENHSQPWNANMGLSFSDDNSGAAFKLSTKGAFDANLVATGYKVWFNAFGVKFQFGDTDIALNKEQIDWATATGIDGNNYSINYSNNGFSIDLALADKWLEINDDKTDDEIYVWYVEEGKKKAAANVKKDDKPTADYEAEVKAAKDAILPPTTDEQKKAAKDAYKTYVINKTYLKVAYSADFGTIGAFMNATETFKNIRFGAGYSNNFSGIDMFANVYADMKESTKYYDKDYDGKPKSGIQSMGVELFAKGSADALSWKAYAKPTMDFEKKRGVDHKLDKNSEAEVGFMDWFGFTVKAVAEYAMDACTPYAELKLADTDNTFDTTIKPGVKGKIGACDWDVGAELVIDTNNGTNKESKKATCTDVSFAIPVSFAVAF